MQSDKFIDSYVRIEYSHSQDKSHAIQFCASFVCRLRHRLLTPKPVMQMQKIHTTDHGNTIECESEVAFYGGGCGAAAAATP